MSIDPSRTHRRYLCNNMKKPSNFENDGVTGAPLRGAERVPARMDQGRSSSGRRAARNRSGARHHDDRWLACTLGDRPHIGKALAGRLDPFAEVYARVRFNREPEESRRPAAIPSLFHSGRRVARRTANEKTTNDRCAFIRRHRPLWPHREAGRAYRRGLVEVLSGAVTAV